MVSDGSHICESLNGWVVKVGEVGENLKCHYLYNHLFYCNDEEEEDNKTGWEQEQKLDSIVGLSYAKREPGTFHNFYAYYYV